MVNRLRWRVVVAVILSVMLVHLTPVLGSFDDDDPDNDPNACHAAEDPQNCNWECGWFQAAVNMGQVTLEAARTTCPDLQATDWLPEEERARRETQARVNAELFADDDPTNDPNTCFVSDEPNCDWVRGWYNAIYGTSVDLPEDETSDEISDFWKKSFLSYLEASRKAELDDPLSGPDGTNIFLDITWFCPPGVEGYCEAPPNDCGPGDNYLLGECFIRR